MKSSRKELFFQIPARRGLVNITRDVQAAIDESGIRETLENADGEKFPVRDVVNIGFSGGEITLDVTLEVPITLGDEYQNDIGYIDWEFKVEELDVSPFDPVGPRTGDTAQVVLYAAAVCGSLGLMSVLILVSRRKKSGE